MSRRQAKVQASSSRAVSGAFGSGFGSTAFGSTPSTGFGATSSQLSYIAEPPNLSSISDPNVVVAFKNLAKKDSTTKSKALEDLQAYVSSSEVEEAVLEAWVKIYPRTSIDTDRRVRQLAHTLNGHISVSCGKRIAKYMPQIIGSWLAGLYDNDRSVARAAHDSLQQVFSTSEKLQSVRKIYQQSILEYCRDAILNETPQTLSDERSVSPDDAAAKYTRVIATSIAVVTSLLTELRPEDIAKQQSLYDGLTQSPKLWDFASHSDTTVRRAVHRLLRALVSSQSDTLSSHLDVLSMSYLYKGLHADQTGSSFDYVGALVTLTTAFPSVWTDNYKGKKSVTHRLRQFLKSGSQGGPAGFWDNVAKLIQMIPRSALGGADDAIELLSAMRSGINRREELRINVATAFNAYVDVAAALSVSLADEDQRKLASEALLPLLSQFIKPLPERSDWTIPGSQAAATISKAMQMSSIIQLLGSEWKRISAQLIEDVKTSLPEQSKDFDRSQKAVSDEGQRWASVQKGILTGPASPELRSVFSQSVLDVVSECLEVLKTRNGKPYGAAGVVDSVVQLSDGNFFGSKEATDLVASFVKQDLPGLFPSPSCSKLASILYAFSKEGWFQDTWRRTLQTVLNIPDSASKSSALQELVAPSHVLKDFELAASSAELQSYLVRQSQLAIEGTSDWSVVSHALKNPVKVLAPATTEDILASMTEALTIEDKAANALHGFEEVSKQNAAILKEFMSKPEGSTLLPKLLFLTESPDDDVARTASSLNSLLQSAIMQGGTGSQQTMSEVIQNGLNEASSNSVSVHTLVDLAKEILSHTTQSEEKRTIVERLLPNPTRWGEALRRHLQLAPRPALAIMNTLGGAVYLVNPEAVDVSAEGVSADTDGYSVALRMALYATKTIKTTDVHEYMTADQRANILRELILSVRLANDNLGLLGSNSLWTASTPEVENEMVDFVADAQSLINEWLRACNTWSSAEVNSQDYAFVKSAVDHLLSDATGRSAFAFHNARAYSVTVAELVDMHGWQKKDEERMENQLRTLRRSKDTLATIAFLSGLSVPLSKTKYFARLCNELVADLTGQNITAKPDEGLQQLVLLNTIIQVQDTAETIAKQRLIFFVKHVIPWLQQQDPSLSVPVQAEVCRVLSVMLPYMNDIYGSHWSDILSYLTELWSGIPSLETDQDYLLPVLHASLKLLDVLRRLKSNEEANDDLQDAWKEAEGAIARGLITLLKQARGVPDVYHQPMMILNELLARQISHLPLKYIDDPSELFPLLYVGSRPVQQTAFDILHKQIPAAQEQISFDAALDKKDARLPEELLSLILEAPAAADLADTSFERATPLHLRGYLYSWLLVFDHFQNSSYKVKTDYIENIKDGGYINGLLDFTFDFLGHGRGKPVDVSKFDITTYNADELDSPLKDTQWLLTNLYYLCLKHVPSLVKAWWIDCKSRQKVISVESWTEKHISPHIIADALSTVTAWSTTTASDPDNENLTIKVSPRAREITASYLVDEQTMTIRISLPPTYPLRQATVEGLARVAVPEAKWQSWLRNTQGVIAFSNGNLVDGLTAWRKNVVGALRGQTECAICYSIVGADRTLPSKRCSTCKNSFHGGCLFRWFKTSNGSSCPLCRNPFNYG